MARTKKENSDSGEFDIEKFADNMLNQMNDVLGEQMVFNLGENENPAKIEKWYSTSCRLLDWVLSGRKDGGFPGGRFCEIHGAESIGKSHISYQVVRSVLENGGLVNYCDTERASDVKNLKNLKIDINSKRFQYSKPDSIENVFRVIENFLKLAESIPKDKKPLICFVWDSLIGVGSEVEAEMDFADAQRPGVNAKQIAFGFRKIRNAIDRNNALLLIVNQVYDVINAGMYEKKTKAKGGAAPRYDSTVRVELNAFGEVYPDEMERQEAVAKGLMPIGIKVRAYIAKNRVAPPKRSVEFEIHFGVGIKEHNSIWELLNKEEEINLGNDLVFKVIGNGAWKEFGVFKKGTGEEIVNSGKFRKRDLEEKLMVEHKKIINDAIDVIMARKMSADNDEYKDAIDPSMLEVNDDEAFDEVG